MQYENSPECENMTVAMVMRDTARKTNQLTNSRVLYVTSR